MTSATHAQTGAAQAGGSRCMLCVGHPRFEDTHIKRIAANEGVAAAWIEAFSRFGVEAPGRVRGDFAVAVSDAAGRTLLAVDRFSICTLCYRFENNTLTIAERADDLSGSSPQVDAQALFDYLYFHVIPAPRTVFQRVQRLPAGHYALFDKGRLTVAKWWLPVFEENRREPFDKLRGEFRGVLRDAIRRQIDGRHTGCFLSGGTDSSTVAGMLGAVTERPPKTFSIGFDAEGYDEMEYARMAARHFKSDHHEYYITPDDLVRSIPQVAAWYDQPFGNLSVLPTYYCARLAKDAGVNHLLGGDGGDELFGGNARYAKQKIFDVYERIPQAARKRLLEPALLGVPMFAEVPGVRKAVSYVEQASIPMPARMETYNLLVRLGVQEVFTDEFLAQIDNEEPLRQQKAVYADCSAHTLINRMLAFDWRYTLADNDLPKVRGATLLAGVTAGFPLLDDALVDFSLRLHPHLKLKGLKLRWFFKEALRSFLPDETLAKKKHGFGLPFGTWMLRHAGLQALVLDRLASLGDRGIVRTGFLDRLMRELLPAHAPYYGEMVWILVMMEEWHRSDGARRTGTTLQQVTCASP